MEKVKYKELRELVMKSNIDKFPFFERHGTLGGCSDCSCTEPDEHTHSEEKITIADILEAIRDNASIKVQIDRSGFIRRCHGNTKEVIAVYDLREDDLKLQSEEFLRFIYGVLFESRV